MENSPSRDFVKYTTQRTSIKPLKMPRVEGQLNPSWFGIHRLYKSIYYLLEYNLLWLIRVDYSLLLFSQFLLCDPGRMEFQRFGRHHLDIRCTLPGFCGLSLVTLCCIRLEFRVQMACPGTILFKPYPSTFALAFPIFALFCQRCKRFDFFVRIGEIVSGDITC